MCQGLAPTAMRTPISRVRSVTLTSMMFMMPMPAHQQRDGGDAGQQQGQGAGALVLGGGGLGQVADGEVVAAPRPRCWWRSRSSAVTWRSARAVASGEVAPTRSGPVMKLPRPPWMVAWKVFTGM